MLSDPHLLLHSISVGILTLDEAGYIKYANRAATAMTGYTAAELLNKSFSLFYPNNHDLIKSEYELSQAKKKGKFIAEGWKLKKDSSRFWAEITISALYDDQRKSVIGYSCIVQDNSEKKKEELELRKSEELFRLMVEGIKDYSIIMLDTNGLILTWNDGAKAINGYSVNELIGKHFSAFYTADDIEKKKPERELEEAVKHGRLEDEGWRVKKNGSLFWANIVITPLYDGQNKFIGYSQVTRDLTERKENEEVLRQSEERYRSLVEQVTDYGIFMMDEKGRIVNWNEGAKRIKGYTADDILGKYFTIFYPEEDILNGKPAFELKYAKAVGKYEEEGWRIRKDGSLFWANVVITAVYNANGTHIGFSKVTRDLTERKESEKALRESHDRYLRLADELKAKNDELSSTNQELEQFTSIVSHDLQEPVRTIKSFLQLIDMKLEEQAYADLKTYIGKSIQAANRMRELIQNLLHYSQLSKDDIALESVNVEELFNRALQNVKTLVETSGAQVTIEREVDTVQGDPVQLVQLIQNLLSNALKFTDTAAPQVTLRCRRVNGRIQFSVADNGIGIAEDDYVKVFEIFRRLNTRKDFPGTGIGLAICKKIIDRHRGRIWLQSQMGEGTTFYFTLNDEVDQSIPAKSNEEV